MFASTECISLMLINTQEITRQMLLAVSVEFSGNASHFFSIRISGTEQNWLTSFKSSELSTIISGEGGESSLIIL
jgi:hypothetical protein